MCKMKIKPSFYVNKEFEKIGYKRSLYEEDDEVAFDNDSEDTRISCINGYFKIETYYGTETSFGLDEIIVCSEWAKEIKKDM